MILTDGQAAACYEAVYEGFETNADFDVVFDPSDGTARAVFSGCKASSEVVVWSNCAMSDFGPDWNTNNTTMEEFVEAGRQAFGQIEVDCDE